MQMRKVLAHYKNSEACSVYLAVCVLEVLENMDTLEYHSIIFLWYCINSEKHSIDF